MKRITFNKNFSSPVFGNVWIGRTIEVKPKDAEKYIGMGWAKLVQEKIEETKAVYAAKVEESNDADSKPKRSKKSSKSRSK